MATNLIFRAKNLQEFTVTTTVPEDFRFNGIVPFDLHITDGKISAKVWAVDFNEAAERVDIFLDSNKNN
jgi:hypothetical protein